MGSIDRFGSTPDWLNSTVSTSSSLRNNATAPASEITDQVQIPAVPDLSQVEQLQDKPAQFTDVLLDTVNKLKEAVHKTTNPLEASYLSGMLNRFQLALDSGIPPAGEPPPSTPSPSKTSPSKI